MEKYIHLDVTATGDVVPRPRGPSGSATEARYVQIADYVRGLVSKAKPGDRMPSDAELCEMFDVSRMTARQAMQLVAADGLVERRRGAGTFVRAKPVPRYLGSPLSFSESVAERGMVPSSRTLQSERITPSEDEQSALGLAEGEMAYVLERLRLADGAPMAIERVVMPLGLVAQLEVGFADGSLHTAFEKAGRSPMEAHAEVSAKAATKRQRDLLGLPQHGVVICERRTIFDQAHQPLERTETCYSTSRYSFRAVLRNDRERRP